ncbi:hypothetical protein SRHO_G00177040 [Serrasalmus rhombeus]
MNRDSKTSLTADPTSASESGCKLLFPEAFPIMTLRVFLALLLPLLVGSTSVSQELFPTDCSDVYTNGDKLSGVYTIYPAGDTPVQVYCDMGCNGDIKDAKWTVIQRRMDGSVNFYRPWEQYKKGFGNKYGEYWLGHLQLDYLPSLHLTSKALVTEPSPDLPLDSGTLFHYW